MAVLTASGLTKRFEGVCAVDGVDLVLGEGEVRGLLGPNGAGKTTLLRMLLGLVRADGGTIELLGRRADGPDGPDGPDGRDGLALNGAREPNHVPALAGVAGFVEEPCFYPYLSGRANLEVLAELDDDGARGRIDDVLERVRLTERAGDRVGGYSSGMRQRLGIAAALMRAPRLLLLDEPTSALDPPGARLVIELLRTLSNDGVGVLLSSNKLEEIERVCDSFTVLSRGRTVWDGDTRRMRAEAPPSAAMSPLESLFFALTDQC